MWKQCKLHRMIHIYHKQVVYYFIEGTWASMDFGMGMGRSGTSPQWMKGDSILVATDR